MADVRLRMLDLIDRLKQLAENANKVPLSSRILLDGQALKQTLQQLEDSVDPDIRNARAVLDQEKVILNSANQEAEKTVREANSTAKATTEDADRRAQAMLADAQSRANEMARDAADKANAMVADAQNRANAMLADAQARAEQMVSENEIVVRAKREADGIFQAAKNNSDRYQAMVNGQVNDLLLTADNALSQQMDAIRQLRQDFTARQNGVTQEDIQSF